MVRFDCTKSERAIVEQIAARAFMLASKAGVRRSLNRQIDIEMDIIATHLNGRPLRLQELLDADDFNFAHDVFGIHRHLDRETGELGGCFVPRFAVRQ